MEEEQIDITGIPLGELNSSLPITISERHTYVINFDNVNTVDDIKVIIKAMNLTFHLEDPVAYNLFLPLFEKGILKPKT